MQPVNLTVDGKHMRLVRHLGRGLLAEVREVELEDDTTGSQFYAKIALSAADNDLLEREHNNLLRLASQGKDGSTEEFMSTQRISIPHPYMSVMVLGGDGQQHRANIQCVSPAYHLTAQQLIESEWPMGLPLEHVYWIIRKVLLTLWAAHQHGHIVHGGVTPDHVLVYPDKVGSKQNNGHGVVLIDWTSSATVNKEHIPVINPTWEAFYPPEVRARSLASPTMDIYMVGALALYLSGGRVVKKIAPSSMPDVVANDILKCLEEKPRKRPQDAEEFHRHFGATIEIAHGKREYAPLEVL